MKVVSDSVKIVMDEVGIRSINKEGREQAKKFGVEQYEMRHFSKDRPFLENLVSLSLSVSTMDV
ncbi:Arginase protein [Spatholobus suberectus]|nr:Arginase protein [Spatholobus suberectus]